MNIVPMEEKHRNAVKNMMRIFYRSPAVHSNGSEEIFDSDIDNCINECQFLEGYVFCHEEEILGYSMIAKSFSTEFGKPCIWIEDIFVKEEHRGKGIGKSFFDYIDKKYPNALKRLEAESENKGAVRLYKNCGFDILPYLELIK
ncbi:MAG: GNAT family N-acetyltransferase [Ruminococcaceae bacterium]|nr:GNAT family N-acetyltransferase [Oscillospiraceae bacterium]